MMPKLNSPALLSKNNKVCFCPLIWYPLCNESGTVIQSRRLSLKLSLKNAKAFLGDIRSRSTTGIRHVGAHVLYSTYGAYP